MEIIQSDGLSDLTLLTRYLNGGLNADANQLTRMDANQNKVIEMQDYNKILNCYFGADTAQRVTANSYTTPNNEAITYCVYDCKLGREVGTYTLPASTTANYNMRSIEQYDDYVDAQNLNVVDIEPGGSGFIVGDNLVATAAHCVYNKKTNEYYGNHSLIVYDDNVTNEEAVYEAAYIHIPQVYKGSNGGNYDYALIYVEDNAEGNISQHGVWSLGCMAQEFASTGSEVFSSGYKGTGFEGTFNRYYSSGPIMADTNSYYIHTEAKCYNGKSGGPIYYEVDYDGNKVKTVIGINTHIIVNNNQEPIDNSRTWGARITPTLLKFYLGNPNIELYAN